MPDPTTAAVQTLETPAQPGSAARALRLALGALLLLSTMIIAQTVSAEPAAAGSSCTGWTSLTTPPPTIRVLRTRTGAVQTVGFRKYVARVMASGEWPSRLKMATLEVGALATKQFAWYYTMKGHHRSHYVRGGKCYDVRDDTSDQLYKHYASPDSRQSKAIDKTWGLSLRKNGSFFLTGYRAGTSGTCGADANGWKLYAKSVQDCSRKGWSYDRILRKYLSPNLTFVWSKRIGPAVSQPSIALKVDNTIATGAVTLKWQPVPKSAKVAKFELERKVDDGAWKDVGLKRPKAWKTDAWVKLGSKTRFRVRAKDTKGNWGRWSYGPTRRAVVRGPAGTTIAGVVGTAAVEPQKVRASFTGRAVALVTRTGPGMGKVRVLVDGVRVATVDLDRAAVRKRHLVWTKNWSEARAHTVAVKPLHARKRVDFSGFLVLR